MNPSHNEARAREATRTYFQVRPDIGRATARVLSRRNRNGITGEGWLARIDRCRPGGPFRRLPRVSVLAFLSAVLFWFLLPLLAACGDGNISTVGGALASFEFTPPQPIIEAVKARDLEEVRRLIAAGADPNALDGAGSTALTMAAGMGSTDIVAFLLKVGADPDRRDNAGSTPLDWAIWGGHREVVVVLLKGGANPNGKDGNRMTPLMWACIHDDRAIAETLLAAGAKVSTRDPQGRTALARAAEKGSLHVLDLLLDHGADINSRDKAGMTALMYAAGAGFADVVEFLLAHGAKVNLRNNSGKTALRIARQGHHGLIAQMLERAGGIDEEPTPSDDPGGMYVGKRVGARTGFWNSAPAESRTPVSAGHGDDRGPFADAGRSPAADLFPGWVEQVGFEERTPDILLKVPIGRDRRIDLELNRTGNVGDWGSGSNGTENRFKPLVVR